MTKILKTCLQLTGVLAASVGLIASAQANGFMVCHHGYCHWVNDSAHVHRVLITPRGVVTVNRNAHNGNVKKTITDAWGDRTVVRKKGDEVVVRKCDAFGNCVKHKH
jgi:hypothetical protein